MGQSPKEIINTSFLPPIFPSFGEDTRSQLMYLSNRSWVVGGLYRRSTELSDSIELSAGEARTRSYSLYADFMNQPMMVSSWNVFSFSARTGLVNLETNGKFMSLLRHETINKGQADRKIRLLKSEKPVSLSSRKDQPIGTTALQVISTKTVYVGEPSPVKIGNKEVTARRDAIGHFRT